MKKIVLFLIILFASCLVMQAQEDLFKKHGVTKEPLTLSKGKYKETFYNEEVMQIGTVLINTETEKVVKFLEEDTTKYAYRAEATSRFISVDPLCEENYSWSPYVYAMNNPLRFVDPDGRLARDSVGNIIYNPLDKIDENQNKRLIDFQDGTGRSITMNYQYVTIYADDGTPIEVQQVTGASFVNSKGETVELMGNTALQGQLGVDIMSNCHGLAFADGQFIMSPTAVNSVLKGDGYTQVSDPLNAQVGLVQDGRNVARGDYGEWYHSARVDGIGLGTFRDKDDIGKIRTGVPYHQLKNFNGHGNTQTTTYFRKRR